MWLPAAWECADASRHSHGTCTLASRTDAGFPDAELTGGAGHTRAARRSRGQKALPRFRWPSGRMVTRRIQNRRPSCARPCARPAFAPPPHAVAHESPPVVRYPVPVCKHSLSTYEVEGRKTLPFSRTRVDRPRTSVAVIAGVRMGVRREVSRLMSPSDSTP